MPHLLFPWRKSIAAAILYSVAVSISPTAKAAAVPESASASFAIPASDDGLPGVGPLRRQDWFQAHWRERRAGWAATREQDQGSVVFLGDSITEGWGGGLGAAFPGLKVANRGISGDTTRGVLIRLADDVLALKPKAVVLLIGTNDLAEQGSPEDAAANVRQMIEACEAHDSRMPIVLCQVFPSSASEKRPAGQIKALNALYLEAARNRANVTYLETWPMFAGPDGDARASEFPDLLHPNEAGYAKWAAALRPVFSTLGLIVEPAPWEPEPGFVSLFNGSDLTGWGYRPTAAAEIESAKRRDAASARPPVRIFHPDRVSFRGVSSTPEGRYLVRNGAIVVATPPEYRKIQQLWTERDYPEDFVLRLEFRATPNADSGVFLRGTQLQVRDYLVAGPYNQLQHFRPQEWNVLEVTVRGGSALCTCNGEVIESSFKVPASGPIGLEGDRGQVEYRRIWVKTLP